MADQIIEFTAGAGETFTSFKACAAGADTPIKTANSVAAVTNHPGLYRAVFTDQELATGLWRFWALAGSDFVGRGMVNITAATGTFRETAESSATVDLSGSIGGIVDGVVSGINEAGIAVSMALPEFLDQLQAGNYFLPTNPPNLGTITIYSGCDHLQANSNGFIRRNPAGTWPNLSTRTVWLEIQLPGKTTRQQAVVVTPTGTGQEIVGEMSRSTLIAAGILSGDGEFLFVAETTAGERFPMGGGILRVKYGVKPT